VVKLEREYERPAKPEVHDITIKLFKLFQKLLDEEKLKAYPTEIVGRGSDAILKGLRELKSGSVSGKRLVVLIE
jgi:hypothetical protein